MDLEVFKKKLPVIIPACIAIFSSIYVLSKPKTKKGFKEIPYPPGLINWPIFGK